MEDDQYESKLGFSLFSGAGIGDIGFQSEGIEFIAMSEINKDMAKLLQLNFPKAKIFGDIYEDKTEIINHIKNVEMENNQKIFLGCCTAPCQGMSKSGQGTLLNNVRKGKRPKFDPRNRLILPGLDIISEIKPLFIFFENVIEMQNTLIEYNNGKLKKIIDIIDEVLSPDYVGLPYDVEFADYGIPQKRQRLITVYTRHKETKELFYQGIPLIPSITHSEDTKKRGKKKWISVGEEIKDFPPLDAKNQYTARNRDIPYHWVPVLDPKKYEWIKNTPPGGTAFDNQCINPDCNYQNNPTHGTKRTKEGINRSKKDTPLYCIKCGSLLPRPYTETKDGNKRIMSGYTSAYRRMKIDQPASALTRNFSYPCSDHKVHPTQNRVLSFAEAFKIHTLSDFDYKWGPIIKKRKKVNSVSDTIIRLSIGESIPPRVTQILIKYLKKLYSGQIAPNNNMQKNLGFQSTFFSFV